MTELKKTREKEIENKKLLDFIQNNNNRIIAEDYMKLFDVSQPTALKILKDLADEDILDYKKEERGRYVFFIKDEFEERMEKYIENFVKPFL